MMLRVGFAFALATALAAAAPVSATTFIVDFDDTTNIPGNNNFKTQLNALGLTKYANFNTTLSLSQRSTIKFERVAAESGFTNRFTGGSVTGLEADGNRFANPVLIGTGNFAKGSLQGKLFFTTNGNGDVSQIGSEGFGIFLPRAATGQFESKVLYFGFDDLVNKDDDNHDDFILRATVTGVPEPTTWAMLILGFGLVGFAARRTRPAVTA
jgi:hypothetical protein